jgi:phage gp36-like protein
MSDYTEEHYRRLLEEACVEIARYKIENEQLKKDVKRLKVELDFYQFNKNTHKSKVSVFDERKSD